MFSTSATTGQERDPQKGASFAGTPDGALGASTTMASAKGGF